MASHTPHERRRITDKVERDVRGIIGLISVVGLFGVVFLQLAQGASIAIPPEVAGVVGSVVGFYFGSKGATGGEVVAQQAAQGAQQAAQGVQLEEIHSLVDGRFKGMEEKLVGLEAKLATSEAALKTERAK